MGEVAVIAESALAALVAEVAAQLNAFTVPFVLFGQDLHSFTITH
jgi:predicted FMN-binding regulatory protein PaiB